MGLCEASEVVCACVVHAGICISEYKCICVSMNMRAHVCVCRYIHESVYVDTCTCGMCACYGLDARYPPKRCETMQGLEEK